MEVMIAELMRGSHDSRASVEVMIAELVCGSYAKSSTRGGSYDSRATVVCGSYDSRASMWKL